MKPQQELGTYHLSALGVCSKLLSKQVRFGYFSQTIIEFISKHVHNYRMIQIT